ncbi:unnamed protein product [Ectocarpus sp. 12 AP-2014]
MRTPRASVCTRTKWTAAVLQAHWLPLRPYTNAEEVPWRLVSCLHTAGQRRLLPNGLATPDVIAPHHHTSMLFHLSSSAADRQSVFHIVDGHVARVLNASRPS